MSRLCIFEAGNLHIKPGAINHTAISWSSRHDRLEALLAGTKDSVTRFRPKSRDFTGLRLPTQALSINALVRRILARLEALKTIDSSYSPEEFRSIGRKSNVRRGIQDRQVQAPLPASCDP